MKYSSKVEIMKVANEIVDELADAVPSLKEDPVVFYSDDAKRGDFLVETKSGSYMLEVKITDKFFRTVLYNEAHERLAVAKRPRNIELV